LEPTLPAPRRGWLRLTALLTVVVAGIVAAHLTGLTSQLSLANLRMVTELVQSLGWVGPLVYVALWVAACLFFLPGLPVTLLGAAVFGAWGGVLWVVVGSNLGAGAAFLASRYAARPLVESWAMKNPLFRRIDQGVKAHGWRMVMITRLVPLFPFNLQNYAYGLSGIGYPTYALVSLLCMLPGTVAYCLAAGAVISGEGDLRLTLAYLAGGAVILVLVSLLPGWLKKRYRDVAEGDQEPKP
jgi:uncharacterized membrane protein YdjX (TVP38/TMEM64 family)